ncbi:unnamed protein product [Ectocarpus sp. 4 AP-2014]
MYWSSLCDVMSANDGPTHQVLSYVAGKLEADRVNTAAIFANADKVFGDKKGATKLRHDKIRHEEQKAKAKGVTASIDVELLVAGGPGKEAPSNSSLKAIFEMVEMDCRAARHRDALCDELEHEDMLGKVKVMGKEMQRRFKELSEEGTACLLSLTNIDKRVGQAFLHLKETLGDQLGGKTLHEDVWFLFCSYQTAVVHQKEAWNAVTAKLGEVFAKMKNLEGERRMTLRDFMLSATRATGDTWKKLCTLPGPASDAATAVDAGRDAVDQEVHSLANVRMEEKKHDNSKEHILVNTTHIVRADPAPADDSFIETLSAPLESPLVRSMMMIERREGKAIGSKYHAGLMVLSWDGFLHFFDLPSSSTVKKDASASAAFQEISPTISLDDLLANKKDLDEVLMFKSTHTLWLDESSTVEAVSSHKSHKIEVKGRTNITSIKRHFGSGTTSKTVTFRTATEAEMNNTVEEITDCIYTRGGMQTAAAGRMSTDSRSSFGSSFSSTASGSTKLPPNEPEPAPAAPAPTPAPSSTVAPPAPEPTAADPAPPAKEPAPTATPTAETTKSSAAVPAAAPAAPAPAPAAAAATTGAGEASSEASSEAPAEPVTKTV